MSRYDTLVSSEAWQSLVEAVESEIEENEGYSLDSDVLGEILREKLFAVEGLEA